MNATRMIISVGTAFAASKLAAAMSSVEFEDVLGRVGLARRRSHAFENLFWLGAGAAFGAGAALLLAPESGTKTRQKISKEFSKLGEAATDAIRETAESAMALVHTPEEAPKNAKRSSANS